MCVLYCVPCCSTAILLAGMRSILKSEISLGSLASDILKDPRTLLTMCGLDPITCAYICFPSCYTLYSHAVLMTKKRKAPASFNGSSHDNPVASGDNIGDIQLAAPAYCTHHHVHKGPACGEAYSTRLLSVTRVTLFLSANMRYRIWSSGLDNCFPGQLSRKRSSKPFKDIRRNIWKTCGTQDICPRFSSQTVNSSCQDQLMKCAWHVCSLWIASTFIT